MTKLSSPVIGGHKWQKGVLHWLESTNGTDIGGIPVHSLGGNKVLLSTLSGICLPACISINQSGFCGTRVLISMV